MSIAIIQGCGGGQGLAMVKKILEKTTLKIVGLTSNENKTMDEIQKSINNKHLDRLELHSIDLENPSNYESVSEKIITNHGKQSAKFILNLNGVLIPEKSIEQIKLETFERVMRINLLGSVLAAKNLSPLLPKSNRSDQSSDNLPPFGVFASWSARIGSIRDNKLGGWYSYRASKAALNMFVKTFAKELEYQKYNAIAVNIHPGTVKTKLSEPYLGSVDHKIFTVEEAVENLFSTLTSLKKEDNGKFLAYDGSKIEY